MPSYVIVWENNTAGHRAISGHTWPGHSALNIGKDFWVDDFDANVYNCYASWWPAEQGAGFGIKDVIFSKKQKGGASPSIVDDVMVEGYLPDHVIQLDTTASQEQKMKAEWLTVCNKKGGASYKNLKKNCSTIVSRCLHAAGLYGKKWAINNNVFWTPADVRKLAVSAGGSALSWNGFLHVLAQSFIKPDQFKAKTGQKIDYARSGRLCSTGVTCKYQSGETFQW